MVLLDFYFNFPFEIFFIQVEISLFRDLSFSSMMYVLGEVSQID